MAISLAVSPALIRLWLTLKPQRDLYRYLKRRFKFPPIAYSPDYEMTERFGAETIANHPNNGINKLARAGRRRGRCGDVFLIAQLVVSGGAERRLESKPAWMSQEKRCRGKNTRAVISHQVFSGAAWSTVHTVWRISSRKSGVFAPNV